MGVRRHRRGKTYTVTAPLKLEDDLFPLIDVPLEIGDRLGGSPAIDTVEVQVQVNGTWFHGTLRGVLDESWFYEPDEYQPFTHYTAYLYRDMRQTYEGRNVVVGDPITVVLARDTHPDRRKRRGK